jgi:hypothetical protein
VWEVSQLPAGEGLVRISSARRAWNANVSVASAMVRVSTLASSKEHKSDVFGTRSKTAGRPAEKKLLLTRPRHA